MSLLLLVTNFHKVKTPESGATSGESQRSVESGLVVFLVIYDVFIFLHILKADEEMN